MSFSVSRVWDQNVVDTAVDVRSSQFVVNSEERQYTLIVTGELLIDWKVLDSANWVKQFLQPFLLDPIRTLRSAEGAFVGALIDHRSRQTWLFNDPFGNFALHYNHTEEVLIASTNSSSVARRMPAVEADEQGWLEYLGLSFCLNGRTIYRNVYRVPAGALLSFNGATCTHALYADYSYQRSESTSLLDQFTEALRMSVEVSLRDIPFVALTAGYDTRVIWAAAESLGMSKSHTYTHGLASSNDVRIARSIRGKDNPLHHEFQFDERELYQCSTHWSSIIIDSEGHLSSDSAISSLAWEYLCAQQTHTCVDGHGGAIHRRQILKGRSVLPLTLHQRAELLFQNYRAPLLRSCRYEASAHGRIEEACRAAVHAAVATAAQYAEGEDVIDAFYIQQLNAGRYAYSGNAQINQLGLRHPLLGQALYSIVREVPLSARRANRLYDYAIRRLCPRLTRIPLDDAGLLVPYKGFSTWRYAFQVYDRTLRYFNNRLGTPTRQMRKNAIEYDAPYDLAPMRLEALIDGTTSTFYRSQLRELHNKFRSGAKNVRPQLADALRVGLYLNHLQSSELPAPEFIK